MIEPLSPRSDSLLNSSAPTSSLNDKIKNTPLSTNRHVSADAASFIRSGASSPFESDVGTDIGQENRPMASTGFIPRKGLSPTKPKSSPSQNFDIYEETHTGQPPLPPSSIFPVKQENFRSSGSSVEPAAVALPPSSPFKENAYDDTLRRKLARTPSRRVQEDDSSDYDNRSVASEETCFSTFSAVPNADMTLFATLGNRTPKTAARSPRKTRLSDKTPETHVFATPATSRPRHRDITSRPGSPTPRQSKHSSKDGDTTNLLLDFTGLSVSPQRRGHSPAKSTTEPNLLSYINNQRMPSPSKHNQQGPRTPNKRNTMLNLLDFDLPPQPTPRSIPTITVRELESLKSSYLSEISSLKASLSGREAEAASLKKAVGDAERRVGEAQEQVRSERSAREDAEATKAEWEKKGKEVQSLLSKVREECMTEEREKADLLSKLDESKRLREEAELRAEAAASKAAVAQQDDSAPSTATNNNFDGRSSTTSTADIETQVSSRVAAQLDEKMENLARELHAVYKRKHEAKVATLKKTYELRADKRCQDLQTQIEELNRQNDELMAVKDASLSLELAGARRSDKSGSGEEGEKLSALLSERAATIAGLQQEMQAVRDECAHLLREVERERVEKGELVAAVDEMLALQGEVGASSAVEDFRRSIGVGAGTPAQSTHGRTGSGLARPGSGLARPGFGGGGGGGGESRVGRSASGGASAAAGQGHGGMAKSRMMSNIERMGSGYGSGR